MKIENYTTEEGDCCPEARQREIAAEVARKFGGKFRTRRGTDAFGKPVLEVVDAEGFKRAEVRQRYE